MQGHGSRNKGASQYPGITCDWDRRVPSPEYLKEQRKKHLHTLLFPDLDNYKHTWNIPPAARRFLFTQSFLLGGNTPTSVQKLAREFALDGCPGWSTKALFNLRDDFIAAELRKRGRDQTLRLLKACGLPIEKQPEGRVVQTINIIFRWLRFVGDGMAPPSVVVLGLAAWARGLLGPKLGIAWSGEFSDLSPQDWLEAERRCVHVIFFECTCQENGRCPDSRRIASFELSGFVPLVDAKQIRELEEDVRFHHVERIYIDYLSLPDEVGNKRMVPFVQFYKGCHECLTRFSQTAPVALPRVNGYLYAWNSTSLWGEYGHIHHEDYGYKVSAAPSYIALSCDLSPELIDLLKTRLVASGQHSRVLQPEIPVSYSPYEDSWGFRALKVCLSDSKL